VIRTLVTGFGAWGSVLAQRARQHDDYFVCGVVDPDSAKRRIASKMGFESYADLEVAIDQEKPELVIVATPISEAAQASVTSSTRYAHVMVAKPGATTRADADRMIRVADAKDRRLILDYTLLVSPKWQIVCDSLRSLGRVEHVSAMRSTRRDRSTASVLSDLSVHDLALLVSLEPLRGWTLMRSRESLELGWGSVELVSDASASATLQARRDDSMTRVLRVSCEHGSIVWNQTNDTVIVDWNEPALTEYHGPEPAIDLVSRRLDATRWWIEQGIDNRNVFRCVTGLLEDAHTKKETARAA